MINTNVLSKPFGLRFARLSDCTDTISLTHLDSLSLLACERGDAGNAMRASLKRFVRTYETGTPWDEAMDRLMFDLVALQQLTLIGNVLVTDERGPVYMISDIVRNSSEVRLIMDLDDCKSLFRSLSDTSHGVKLPSFATFAMLCHLTCLADDGVFDLGSVDHSGAPISASRETLSVKLVKRWGSNLFAPAVSNTFLDRVMARHAHAVGLARGYRMATPFRFGYALNVEVPAVVWCDALAFVVMHGLYLEDMSRRSDGFLNSLYKAHEENV